MIDFSRRIKMQWFILIWAIPTVSSSWFYGKDASGPADSWYKTHPKCSGSLQSPINYKNDEVSFNQSLGPIVLEGCNTPQNASRGIFFNTGYSLEIFGYRCNISGEGLPGSKFKLNVLYFHWGNSNAEGSEHLVNGMAYPSEIQFFYINIKYHNLTEALTMKDGVAVLAVFLKLSSDDNPALEPIFDTIANIDMTIRKTGFLSRPLNWTSMLPANLGEFYRNNGSLTVPGCNENIMWTVFKNPITISQKQLSILRKIKKDSTEPIGKNFRPIQATNGRTVLATFAAPKYNSTIVPANGVARIFDPSASIILFCTFVGFALKNCF